MAPPALFAVAANVVLPIFLVASLGFAARRALAIDPRPITRLALYVLVPALLFDSLLTTNMGGEEIARIGAYAALLMLIMVGLATATSWALRLDRSTASGLVLGVAFMNATNYGLPATLFAFGQEGFDRAVVFAAFCAILIFSVGAFVAARGRLSWRRALLSTAQIPVLWAGLAGLLLRAAGAELPSPLQRAVGVLASGAIPTVMLLLGMQIAGIRLRQLSGAPFAACVFRLGVSPAIGMALVALLGPTSLTAKVLILEAAMPAAVNVALLAGEFETEPDLVASITLLSTALSVFTVTAWAAYLQSL